MSQPCFVSSHDLMWQTFLHNIPMLIGAPNPRCTLDFSLKGNGL